jgi:cytochrome b subunit of formate dehydrogenase
MFKLTPFLISSYRYTREQSFNTNSLSLANFVGIVVGVLYVLIRLRHLLLAAWLSFEIEMV